MKELVRGLTDHASGSGQRAGVQRATNEFWCSSTAQLASAAPEEIEVDKLPVREPAEDLALRFRQLHEVSGERARLLRREHARGIHDEVVRLAVDREPA